MMVEEPYGKSRKWIEKGREKEKKSWRERNRE